MLKREHAVIQPATAVPTPPSGVNIRSSHLSTRGLAGIQLTYTPSRLEIDTTEGRQEIGYFGPTAHARQLTARTLRGAERAVTRTVADGYRLAAPGAGPEVIAELAFEHAVLSYRDQRIAMTFVPRTPPRITYSPGRVGVDLVY
jgi:hypothetical protein